MPTIFTPPQVDPQTQTRSFRRSRRRRSRLRPPPAYRQAHRRQRRWRRRQLGRPSRRLARPSRASFANPHRHRLRPRRRPDVLHRDHQRILRRQGQRPGQPLRRIRQHLAPHRHPHDPPPQHRYFTSQLPHGRDRAPQHVPRERSHGRVDRPRQTHLPPRRHLAFGDAHARHRLSHRPVDRLARSSPPSTFTSPPTPAATSSTSSRSRTPSISSSASPPWSPRCSISAPHASSPRAKSGSTPPSGTGTPWARCGYSSSSCWSSSSEHLRQAFRMGCLRRLPRYFGAGPGVGALRNRVQLCICLAAALSPAFTTAARAQGCAQCRDNVQATPLPVQQAYRHAIELLAISGLAIFAGGVLVLRRYRQ